MFEVTGKHGMTSINVAQSRFVLCAEVQEIGEIRMGFNQTLSGRLVERRLGRMERAVSAYRGKVLRRGQSGLLAAFGSADGAVLCACEMQRRCDGLLPISGLKFGLQVGIHYGPSGQRASDAPGPTEDMAASLAAVLPQGGVALSDQVVENLPAALRQQSRPMLDAPSGLPAHLFDWRSQASLAEANEVTSASFDSDRESFVPRLIFRHGLKELQFGTDHPVVTFGRDFHNDVFLADKDASRKHCQVVQQPDGCMLVDMSTNGTFVTPDDGVPFVLRRGTVNLRGSGYLSFGQPYSEENSEVVEYEVLGA